MKYLAVKIAIIVIAISSLSATADGPDYFSVYGIKANDVLWMHNRPDYHSRRMLGIPPSANCLMNFGCKNRWCLVSYRGTRGWVNGRYLTEGNCLSRPAPGNVSCRNGQVPVVDNGRTVCQCPGNKWWVDTLNRCASYYEYAQECDRLYPGSEPSDTAPGCKCPDGMSWNKGLNRCTGGY